MGGDSTGVIRCNASVGLVIVGDLSSTMCPVGAHRDDMRKDVAHSEMQGMFHAAAVQVSGQSRK